MRQNQFARKAANDARIQAEAGAPRYLYQNITNAQILLPREDEKGRKTIPGREQFIGGPWFKSIPEAQCLCELPSLQENRLITEIPQQYTAEGPVEYVEQKPSRQPLNERAGGEPQPDILLTEEPVEGVRVVL